MMAKPKPSDVDEELKKQDDEVYGTDYTDGGEKFHDTEDMVKDVTGDEPDEGVPYSIADAIQDDEEAIADGADNPDYPLDDDDLEPENEDLSGD